MKEISTYLRCHVTQGARVSGHLEGLAVVLARVDASREAKVKDLDTSIFREADIIGFEVTMQNARLRRDQMKRVNIFDPMQANHLRTVAMQRNNPLWIETVHIHAQ